MEQIAASLEVVKNAQVDVKACFQELKAFHSFERGGFSVEVSLSSVCDMTKDDLQWAFELMKTSVKEFYISGGWGWKDRDKWEELTHESAWMLMARLKGSGTPCGFVDFRFDLDDNVEVLYCYEIHLMPESRSKGLGKFLMQILELLAHRTKMKKVVLTAFKENERSLRFFADKLNYEEDETSPGFCDPLNSGLYSYTILSKPLMARR